MALFEKSHGFFAIESFLSIFQKEPWLFLLKYYIMTQVHNIDDLLSYRSGPLFQYERTLSNHTCFRAAFGDIEYYLMTHRKRAMALFGPNRT
jgi:hypothetical protein